MKDEPTASSDVFRWTVRLKPENDDSAQRPVHLTVDAIGYTDDDQWTVFEDTHGTVLARRSNTILEVRRSAEPVSHQESDAL